jgi:hypothetical protein
MKLHAYVEWFKRDLAYKAPETWPLHLSQFFIRLTECYPNVDEIEDEETSAADQPAHEFTCPACGAVTRARMADPDRVDVLSTLLRAMARRSVTHRPLRRGLLNSMRYLSRERDAMSLLLRGMARRSAMHRAFHQEAIRLGRVAHATASARAESALAELERTAADALSIDGENNELAIRNQALSGALSGVLDAWNDQDADLVAALDRARAALEAK